MKNITLEQGKYTIEHIDGVGLQVRRHGEPWRDLTGDKLVLALVQRIEALEIALAGAIVKFDEEIHNEYDGTSMLASRLAEINAQRAVLEIV